MRIVAKVGTEYWWKLFCDLVRNLWMLFGLTGNFLNFFASQPVKLFQEYLFCVQLGNYLQILSWFILEFCHYFSKL